MVLQPPKPRVLAPHNRLITNELLEVGFSGSRQKKVLVADPEGDIRELIAYNLGSRGYSIISASNPDECQHRLTPTSGIHLAIIDSHLGNPGELDKLLESAKKAGIKTVLMSTTTMDDVLGTSLTSTSKADAFIQKPFTTKSLFETVERLIGPAINTV
jgi:DNA-binding NtrC family response regulator